LTILDVTSSRDFVFADPGGVAEDWFLQGVLAIRSGRASGLAGNIRGQEQRGGRLHISLWNGLTVEPAPGDAARLEVGCDRRAGTCREKFGNFMNFRGFPHIPGEDWLRATPTRT
jgi:uncharacterized phage protein (TIGR02218 family)